MKCDHDQHIPLLGNLVITGGSSRFEGLPDRIKSDIEKIITSSPSTITSMTQASALSLGMKVRSIAAGPTERALCTWLGGSILASLG
eukprot:CAMPEP_0196763518 /NCGR_PEP_ID=MMETSP1095-20130614/4249_1 /TAXON_ID=96789 ORGANISM="Chromulina nebulosa, Strain UTEXLB2642" /NCGR_SAMPLE_ID=MMETSP1095 /ASSEMBLY_ACC=CAM_ASM_000446 /LENGTH=86 /DNA_ID=CAMNT_0042116899 /DNA_START=919 /DNA_END=1175 /DNA_ORIENTATION=-